MKVSRIALLALISVLVSACAAPTKITSNKAQGYTTEPKRLFILTDIGSDFGKAFADSFQGKLTAIAQDCGAVIEVSKISSLELDANVHTNKMKSFNADASLLIRRNGGTMNGSLLIHVIYDLRLVDVQSNKTVWRANTNFYRGGTAIPITERGEALAVDITNKMKEDQIFRSCPLIKVKT